MDTYTHTHTHTHTNIHTLSLTHTHIHTDVSTEVILRNQASAGLWPAHAWLKNIGMHFSDYR